MGPDICIHPSFIHPSFINQTGRTKRGTKGKHGQLIWKKNNNEIELYLLNPVYIFFKTKQTKQDIYHYVDWSPTRSNRRQSRLKQENQSNVNVDKRCIFSVVVMNTVYYCYLVVQDWECSSCGLGLSVDHRLYIAPTLERLAQYTIPLHELQKMA